MSPAVRGEPHLQPQMPLPDLPQGPVLPAQQPLVSPVVGPAQGFLPEVEDERRAVLVFPEQNLYPGGDTDPDPRARLVAVVDDLAVLDILLSQVHDIHERHPERHETEEGQIRGTLQFRAFPQVQCRHLADGLGGYGPFDGLLPFEPQPRERILPRSDKPLGQGGVVDRPQAAQVTVDGIGPQPLFLQKAMEIGDQGHRHVPQTTGTPLQETFEMPSRHLI